MIGIIDYGLGNIKAFANIYNRLQMPFKIVGTVKELAGIEKIILPGVGAFDHAMSLLNASGMRDKLTQLVIDERKYVLGICVGMQMLAYASDEGSLPGLGWIEGEVKKFDMTRFHKSEPLPHMGWNNIDLVKPHALFHELSADPYFYFLHSYYFRCRNRENILAKTHYGDDFCAIAHAGNIFGIQCHPEKSHQDGVTFLRNFGNL